MEKKLMNVKELSAYISMPEATIYSYVTNGKMPKTCIKKMGRALRFEVVAVDQWVSGLSAVQPNAQEHKQSAH